jgi:hypothetical protein
MAEKVLVQLKNGEVKAYVKPTANLIVAKGIGKFVKEKQSKEVEARETKEEKKVTARKTK